MKTDIKRLNILRDHYIKERERKIAEYEIKREDGENDDVLNALNVEINNLTTKINNIDSLLPPRMT